jgi:hypothetical protein
MFKSSSEPKTKKTKTYNYKLAPLYENAAKLSRIFELANNKIIFLLRANKLFLIFH